MASKPYPDKRRGTWKLKYRPDPAGPWQTITLGKDPRLFSSRPPKTPPADIAARAAEFADIEYRAKHGLTPVRPQARSLVEYAGAYKTLYRDQHDPGSVALLERYLDEFVAWCLGHGVTSVQGVTDVVCRDYLEQRQRRSAATTVRMIRGYLSGLFSRTVQDRLIAANPWVLAPLAKGVRQRKKPRFWTSSEVGRILAVARLAWHRHLILVLAHTGVRISAALAMEWSWISAREQTITVPAEHNKGGFEYDVLLSDLIYKALIDWRAKQGGRYVLARPDGKPYSYHAARDSIRRAIRISGVPVGTPHDFRHTFARELHLGGVPQSVIAAMLGHASIRTTEIYTKMERSDAVAFMRRLALGKAPADPVSDESGSPPASDPT